MKKKYFPSAPLQCAFFLAVLAILAAGCQKAVEPLSQDNGPAALQAKKAQQNLNKKIGHFDQFNLTANNEEYGAPTIDPTLVNAWGLVFNPTGTPWISSQEGHVSNVYNSEGVPRAINPVNIPSPASLTGGNPTGIVFNGVSTDFIIPNHGPAAFIFDGVDGVISAWNGSLGKQAARITVGQGAYTGLAIGSNGGKQYLYAANFATRHIDVWNSSWMMVSMPFTDPGLPQGYAPFNIQNIGGNLFVTYAKVDPTTHESEAGVGKGFVDIYRTDGSFVKRFASMGTLNAPWGVTMAPRSFFEDEMDDMEDADQHEQSYLLVGNFGDGRINAYRMDGKFAGQLRGKKEPIEIEGLWALVFPPSTSTIDQHRLYFTAGPDDETHGLFGYLKARTDD